MSSAKITLYGMSRYFEDREDDLFKNMTIPDQIDKDTLTENIILRGGDFEVLYPDAEFFQMAIKSWSMKWYRTIDKWVTALNIDYNPLENYDRMDDFTITDVGTTAKTVNETSNTSSTGHSTDVSSGTGSTDTENTVSAYNSSVYENDNKSHTDTTNSTSGTTDLSNIGSMTGNTTDNGIHDNTNHNTGRSHGNIGVTTSQQMLQQELDVQYWNLYDKITDLFLGEFTIPIY